MAENNHKYDVVIIGGGPAGMSALLWCAELKLNAVLIEKEAELGGQLLQTYNAIRNYLGFEAANGGELRDVFLRQIAGLNMLTEAEIVEADLEHKTLKLADQSLYSGRAIFIATGVRRRKLLVPGEEEFRGRGILDSGKKSHNDVRGKTVVIAGGGDAALENALILSEGARKVFVVHRGREFRARDEFKRKAEAAHNVEFIFNSEIAKIVGDENVRGVEIQHPSSGERMQVAADAVLIRIGVEPNTEPFRGQIDLDDRGYVQVNANCMTRMHGIFAGGDVANPGAPTISVAVGDGSAAVKAIAAWNADQR
jgi:thioredoxin reductase (NADPH)